jgi:hypothetical protein
MSEIIIQENPTSLILTEVNNQLIIQEQNTSLVLQSIGTQGPQGIQGPTGATGATGPAGPAGPNLIDNTTATTFTGILKGNGATITTATPNVDYATVPLTIVNALIFG